MLHVWNAGNVRRREQTREEDAESRQYIGRRVCEVKDTGREHTVHFECMITNGCKMKLNTVVHDIGIGLTSCDSNRAQYTILEDALFFTWVLAPDPLSLGDVLAIMVGTEYSRRPRAIISFASENWGMVQRTSSASTHSVIYQLGNLLDWLQRDYAEGQSK